MKQIVLASTNQGKVREVAMMVQDMGIEIVPLSETAFQGEIEETGTTFEENAIIKAMQVAKHWAYRRLRMTPDWRSII